MEGIREVKKVERSKMDCKVTERTHALRRYRNLVLFRF